MVSATWACPAWGPGAQVNGLVDLLTAQREEGQCIHFNAGDRVHVEKVGEDDHVCIGKVGSNKPCQWFYATHYDDGRWPDFSSSDNSELATSPPLATTANTPPATTQTYADATAAFNSGDFATAIRIIQPLAEHGNVKAQALLGIMYHDGKGLPQNYAEAMKWYRRAADQGDADAESLVALMYRDGKGVPQDYVRAYMWLALAAQSNEPAASWARDDVARLMTPAQIAEARKLAGDWKPEATIGSLAKPDELPHVELYQKGLFPILTERWVAEGDQRSVIVWKDAKSMKAGHDMMAVGPNKADLDLLFRFVACMVLPGTRAMVSTPGVLITIIEGPSKGCQGTVGNEQLSD